MEDEPRMNFDLPPLGTDTPPAFTDAAGCRAWLAALPAATPIPALAQLTEQLRRLNRVPLAPGERLSLLDDLNAAADPLRQALIPRFAGKPLPLGTAEEAALAALLDLQQALLDGCLRCVESCGGGQSPPLATAIQRALAVLLERQRRLAQARRQPPAAHWRMLHRLLALAEQRQLADAEVPVPGHRRPTTVLATYGAALLIQAAGPHELAPRQLSWMLRWAQRWGGKLRLLTAPPARIEARPLCVALEGEQPATALPGKGDDTRYLDTAELRKSLKQRLARLEQGATPAELQLGDDCPQPACGQLLAQLYPRWCKGGLPRLPDPDGGPCRVVSGLAAIHYHLSGRETPRQEPARTMEQLRREREEIATFGRVKTTATTAARHAPPPEFEIEDDWRLLQAGTGDLHLLRPAATPGARIGSGALCAVARPGTPGLALARVRWLLETGDGLHLSLRPIPAPGTPLTLRTAPGEPWRPAIALPATAEQPASLLLPVGGFRLGETVELAESRGCAATRPCRLGRLLGRGEDHAWAVCE